MRLRTKQAYYFKTASVLFQNCKGLFQNCKHPISDCELLTEITYGALRRNVIKYTINKDMLNSVEGMHVTSTLTSNL